MESSSERVTDVLEHAASFFRRHLRESADLSRLREDLAADVGEAALEKFGIGYAPGGWSVLRDALARDGYSTAELHAAGVIHRSHRSDQLYDHFRSRIIFPVRAPDGELEGFAGLATAPGPSWPQWLTSPEGPRFRRGRALFGVDRAREAIATNATAVVLRDCLEVLRRHRGGESVAVAIVRSNLTRAHRARLEELGAREIVSGDRARRAGGRGP